jgi:predicted AAA+ superfamily ATPase
VLEATFQWLEVPAFSGNAIKRLSEKSKGYMGDTGMTCFAQSISSPQAVPTHPLWGALFETFAVNEIRKQLQLLPYPASLYHWRTHAGAEVDLIIEQDGVLYPVEIKATTIPSKADTSGIAAFRKTYPRKHIGPGIVLCAAESSYKLTEHDIAMPWDAMG